MALDRLAHCLAHSLGGSFERHGHGPSPSIHVSPDDPSKRICRSGHPDKTDDDRPQQCEPSNDRAVPDHDSNRDEEVRMQRQVKAKSLSVKIPKNEPTTVRLNCVLANEEFLTLEIPRYVLERFMVQAKRAIEEAPLLSRRRSSG